MKPALDFCNQNKEKAQKTKNEKDRERERERGREGKRERGQKENWVHNAEQLHKNNTHSAKLTPLAKGIKFSYGDPKLRYFPGILRY